MMQLEQNQEARARRTLASLKAAVGYRELGKDSDGPLWVVIGWMEPTKWRRVGGRGDGAMFAREDE